MATTPSGTGTISVKISLNGSEEIKLQFAALGKAGEKAFADLKAAADKVEAPFSGLSGVAARVREQFAGIGASFRPAQAAFDDLAQRARTFGSELGATVNRVTGIIGLALPLGIGAAATAFFGLSRSAAAAAADLQHNAQAAGLSVESYQRLSAAAGRAGVDAETFGKGIGALSRDLVELASNPAKFAADALERIRSARLTGIIPASLAKDMEQVARAGGEGAREVEKLGLRFQGLSTQNQEFIKSLKLTGNFLADLKIDGTQLDNGILRLKTIDELLPEIADKFSALPNDVRKTAIAMELGAKFGREFIELFDKGGDVFRNAARNVLALAGAEEAARTGVRNQVQDLKDLDLAFRRLDSFSKNVKNQLAAAFGPDLTRLIKAFGDALLSNADRIKQFAAALAKDAKPAIDGLIDALSGRRTVDNEWIFRLRDGVVQFGTAVSGAVTNVIIPAFRGLLAIADVVAKAIGALFGADISGGQLLIGVAVLKLIGVFALLRSAVSLVAAAFVGLATLFGPIGVAVGALAAAILVIATNWKVLADASDAAGQKLQDAAEKMRGIPIIGAVIARILDLIAEGFRSVPKASAAAAEGLQSIADKLQFLGPLGFLFAQQLRLLAEALKLFGSEAKEQENSTETFAEKARKSLQGIVSDAKKMQQEANAEFAKLGGGSTGVSKLSDGAQQAGVTITSAGNKIIDVQKQIDAQAAQSANTQQRLTAERIASLEKLKRNLAEVEGIIGKQKSDGTGQPEIAFNERLAANIKEQIRLFEEDAKAQQKVGDAGAAAGEKITVGFSDAMKRILEYAKATEAAQSVAERAAQLQPFRQFTLGAKEATDAVIVLEKNDRLLTEARLWAERNAAARAAREGATKDAALIDPQPTIDAVESIDQRVDKLADSFTDINPELKAAMAEVGSEIEAEFKAKLDEAGALLDGLAEKRAALDEVGQGFAGIGTEAGQAQTAAALLFDTIMQRAQQTLALLREVAAALKISSAKADPLEPSAAAPGASVTAKAISDASAKEVLAIKDGAIKAVDAINLTSEHEVESDNQNTQRAVESNKQNAESITGGLDFKDCIALVNDNLVTEHDDFIAWYKEIIATIKAKNESAEKPKSETPQATPVPQVTPVPQAAPNLVPDPGLISQLRDAAQQAFDAIRLGAEQLWASVTSTFQSGATNAASAFGIILAGAEQLWASINGTFQSGATAAAAAFDGIVVAAANMASSVAATMSSLATQLDEIVARIERAARAIASAIPAAPAAPGARGGGLVPGFARGGSVVRRGRSPSSLSALMNRIPGFAEGGSWNVSKKDTLTSRHPDGMLDSVSFNLELLIDNIIAGNRAAAEALAKQKGGNAAGGRITGAGTKTSDSILARLSRGEYVIKAAAVDRYGVGVMNMINQMRLPFNAFRRFSFGGMVGNFAAKLAPPMIPGYAAGGLVAASSSSRGGSLHPVTINFEGRSVTGLFAPGNVVDRLKREAIMEQVTSTGPKPRWDR